MYKLLIFFSFCLISIDAHGYLFEPVARSSAWLVDPAFKECCTYSGHMEMFCGGIGHQWNNNGGKCGICGEPYDRAAKLFEKGGRLYLGKVVQTYAQGQQIEVKVKLSANHQGYFEFRLCSVDNNPDADATQECLDNHLLTVIDSNSTKHSDIYRHGSGMITVRVQLPSNLACQHCVFQWKYTTGNNWGRDPITNKSGPGLGKENETFMGCSDISITPKRTTTIRPPRLFISKAAATTTKKSSTSTSADYWILLLSKYWSLPPMKHQSKTTTTTTTTTKMSSFKSSKKTKTRTTTPITTSAAIIRSVAQISMWSSLLVPYKKGDEVVYNGTKYRCVTSHRSYAGSEPSLLTWALWRKVT
ncbi:unnamed protein product [Adineta ricciae]|uniref:Chitin-binding type-3 domain-containing protein n=1 Tax=Adineta ricciae TaxID=249248 RepID=A0A814AWV8_ADIRI|nr:unnamed protein product [Adineta ricciae]CAF1255478.1 unnamed protein product [Adineta ricciae]